MTSFGMNRSVTRLRNRIRWALGILSVIAVCLAIGLTGYVYASTKRQAVPLVEQNTLASREEKHVALLVPKVRIEAGSRLEAFQFDVVEFPLEVAPPGLVTAADKDGVLGSYALRLLVPQKPFSHAEISPHPPLTAIEIPKGHRAITIHADARNLIDGFVRPRSRVDVLWSYVNPRQQKKVRVLVPFTKVLAINGSTDPNVVVNPSENNTATLLVSQEDAGRIELAQSEGELSLALMGSDVGSVEPSTGETTVDSLYDDSDRKRGGRLMTTNPKTGELVALELVNDQWVRTE